MLLNNNEQEHLSMARRRLGGRAVGWLLSEVSAWQQSRSKAE